MSIKSEPVFGNSIVVRTPIGHTRKLKNLHVKSMLGDLQFMNAVALASPDLIMALNKKFPILKKDREYRSLLKYYIRYNSRCTPFGLFAGAGVSQWVDHKSGIKVNSKFDKTFTTIDMGLVRLVNKLVERNSSIVAGATFISNNTLMKRNGAYTYLESDMGKLQFSRIQSNDLLDDIIAITSSPVSYTALNRLAESYGLSIIQSKNFINNLISANIIFICNIASRSRLISNKSTFSEKDSRASATVESMFKTLNDAASELDQNYIKGKLNIIRLNERMDQQLNLPRKFKNKFQVDLFRTNLVGGLNCRVKKALVEGISISLALNSAKVESSRLQKFKSEFYLKYGDSFIPLLQALDHEYGCGWIYLSNRNPLNSKLKPIGDLVLGKKERFLMSKLLELDSIAQKEIVLNEPEIIEHFKPNIHPSFSNAVLFKHHGIQNGKDVIELTNGSGSSGVNLITRFSTKNKRMKELVSSLISEETKHLDPNSWVFVEVFHSPTPRSSNVAQRPNTYKYRLSIVNQFGQNCSDEHEIKLNEIYLTIYKNNLYLYCPRLSRFLIPRHSTALKYQSDSAPIFHFLCDLQNQAFQTSNTFNWGTLSQQLNFFPRVITQEHGTILSPQTLVFRAPDSWNKKLHKAQKKNILLKALLKYEFGNQVIFAEGDRELQVDLESDEQVDILIDNLDAKKTIKLKENIQKKNISCS